MRTRNKKQYFSKGGIFIISYFDLLNDSEYLFNSFVYQYTMKPKRNRKGGRNYAPRKHRK